VQKREIMVANRDAILALAAKHGMTDLRLFGSVARGDERPDSDIDFFVRREPGSDPFLVFEFKNALSALLGCKVDVIVEQKLMRPRLRDTILAEAVPL